MNLENFLSALIGGFWEVYYLDEKGDIIEHTEENHRNLVFKDKDSLESFCLNLEVQDVPYTIYRMN